MQNACLQALQHADRFDNRSQLATWLHRITVNSSFDVLRKNGRNGNESLGTGDQLTGLPLYLKSNPALVAERRELHAIAAALIDDLPDDCRLAFALTQLDGYSYSEAADIEGVARGTVASRVFRARKLLAKVLGEKLGETKGID